VGAAEGEEVAKELGEPRVVRLRRLGEGAAQTGLEAGLRGEEAVFLRGQGPVEEDKLDSGRKLMSRNGVERRDIPQEARAEGEESLVRSALRGEAETGNRIEGSVGRTLEENDGVLLERDLVRGAPLEAGVGQAVEEPSAEGTGDDASAKERSPVGLGDI
jgi:hypothetical protein